MSELPIHALILAGGSGTRFWPLSREERPKQLLALKGGTGLLRATLDRLAPLVERERVWVCATRRLAAAVRRELPELDEARVLAEPEGRNTAPAIAWSLASLPESTLDAPLAVLPSDHWVEDPAAFRRALEQAAAVVAERDAVLTLGVTPHRPETGYGYLELARAPGAELEAIPLRGFVEKPDAERARRFLESGRYLWNAGIFVFRPRRLLELFAEHQPAISRGLDAVVAAAADPHREAELYRALPAVSIDRGLMEPLAASGTVAIETVPLDCGWSDLGSWESLAESIGPGDAAGNRVRGEAVVVDAADNLLFADQGLVAVVGVSGLAVVRTGDAVLVMPRERAQDVRRIVEELRRRGRGDLL